MIPKFDKKYRFKWKKTKVEKIIIWSSVGLYTLVAIGYILKGSGLWEGF